MLVPGLTPAGREMVPGAWPTGLDMRIIVGCGAAFTGDMLDSICTGDWGNTGAGWEIEIGMGAGERLFLVKPNIKITKSMI